MTFSLQEWRAGEWPVTLKGKRTGFDIADCIENGWSREDVNAMLRQAVCDELPDFPEERAVIYSFSDWQSGKPAPKDFDIADRAAYGWTKEQIHAMRKELVCDELPDFPEAKEAPRVANLKRRRGADGIHQMSRVVDIEQGGEVGIAQHFAVVLEALCGSVVKSDGAFWAWGPTAWVELDHQALRLAVHSYNGTTIQGKSPIKLSSRAIDGVLAETGTILGDATFFAEPTVGLNARNSVVRIDQAGSITAHNHSPNDRFRFTIDADFTGEAALPPAGSLLHTLLNGAFLGDPDATDKINLVGEILGAAAFGMATRLPQPKAFVFLGETASNGKSTIASLVECLLPEGAVSHIPPSALEDERRRVHLAGKAANVADELSASSIAGETLKSCVTGQAIDGRDVYKSALTFTPRALHLYTTNVLPRFNGGLDRGLQRRLLVIRFNRTIPAEEIIPDIAARIRSDELDLLLQFAVAGAQRLTLHRAYTEPASSREALKDWLRLDPLNEWFEERVERADQPPSEGWHSTSTLYFDFKSWAIDQGHSEKFLPPVNTFSQRLKAMPGIDTKRSGRIRCIAGVVLRSTQVRSPHDSGW
jgi:hypothetical protein